MRRKLKNFLAAIVITILAIGYYSWMFPAWNRINESANDRDISPLEERVFVNGMSQQEKTKQKTFTFDELIFPDEEESSAPVSNKVVFKEGEQLKKTFTYILEENGHILDIPEEENEEFKTVAGNEAHPAQNFRVNNKTITIDNRLVEDFLQDFPAAEPVTRMRLANGKTRDFTQAELATIPSSAYAKTVACSISTEDVKPQNVAPRKKYPSPPKKSKVQAVEYPMPQSAYFIAYPRHKCDSVLAINTAKGASYVIKLVDVQNEEDILTYFLPGGVRREIDVPSGDFELRYTCGTRWYGVEKLFGPNAAFAKADCVFYFREGSGYEVTLYGVKDGNLRTIAISGEDF